MNNDLLSFAGFIAEAKGPYVYKPARKPNFVKTGKGHTYVGGTETESGGLKGANVFKHKETGKYFAAGGSSSAITKSTTFHETPEEAAKAYHSKSKEEVK